MYFLRYGTLYSRKFIMETYFTLTTTSTPQLVSLRVLFCNPQTWLYWRRRSFNFSFSPASINVWLMACLSWFTCSLSFPLSTVCVYMSMCKSNDMSIFYNVNCINNIMRRDKPPGNGIFVDSLLQVICARKKKSLLFFFFNYNVIYKNVIYSANNTYYNNS